MVKMMVYMFWLFRTVSDSTNTWKKHLYSESYDSLRGER